MSLEFIDRYILLVIKSEKLQKHDIVLNRFPFGSDGVATVAEVKRCKVISFVITKETRRYASLPRLLRHHREQMETRLLIQRTPGYIFSHGVRLKLKKNLRKAIVPWGKCPVVGVGGSCVSPSHILLKKALTSLTDGCVILLTEGSTRLMFTNRFLDAEVSTFICTINFENTLKVTSPTVSDDS